MKYYFLCLLILLLSACKIPNYVILDTGEKIDCNKAVKYWYGNRGDTPSSQEVKELCACFDWTIQSRE